MFLISRRTLLLAGTAFALRPLDVFADTLHCCHCRSHNHCKKVCRLVYEEKKVEVICWGGKCEDFCIPGPSTKGCRHCEMICGTCENCYDGVAAKSKKFVWYDWIPGCANHIRTKNKLMKKIEVKKIPSYKWVVEDICGDCRKNIVEMAVPADAEIPPPPTIGEPLQYVRLGSSSSPAQ